MLMEGSMAASRDEGVKELSEATTPDQLVVVEAGVVVAGGG